MHTTIYVLINAALVAVFIYIMKKRNFLSFYENSRWWLTALAVGIITLMDELTSIYYAPYEAYRFIGLKAIFYIALTSLFIRMISFRMVEISEILERNNIKGGGVYSFSYLVFGSSLSFIAFASILVDYILTATISTVAAVENGTYFMELTYATKMILKFGVIWGITLLNIIGIRENAKFTFYIFLCCAFVLINMIVGGFMNFNGEVVNNIATGWHGFIGDFWGANDLFHSYGAVIIGIGSCILAYSGVESVLQTQSLVKNWKQVHKAYIFLALTVGITTPIIALLAISGTLNLESHETNLIPSFAALVHGPAFGVIVGALASFTLIMAVNTAMIASGELIEKVAERYRFHWLTKMNNRQSFYRIHVINGLFYSTILIITSGSQAMLAEMYAVGLVASFVMNVGALLYYRFSKGTRGSQYSTNRFVTLILFIVLVSVLFYIMWHRPYGTTMWFVMSLAILLIGLRISKYRGPEIEVRKLSDTPMDLMLRMFESESEEIHVHFRRPLAHSLKSMPENHFYITFFSPRYETPEKMHKNHFMFSLPPRMRLFNMIVAILKTIEYELPEDKTLHVHFGWPLSSWLDRLTIGFEIFNILHLPRRFPTFDFHINYLRVQHKPIIEKQRKIKDM